MFLEAIENQKRKRKMKRDRELGKMDTGKEKMWAEQQQQQQAQADAGMDELFAVLGYKVKSSDMADVAEKLQQLEMAMCSSTADDDDDTSFLLLSNDTTVHRNPSDLSGWVQSMLSELNPNISSSSSTSKDIYDDDLRAIPGGAVFNNNNNNNNNTNNNNKDKRMKLESESESPPRPALVLVDSQETGIRLVHTLMACAEAVQQGNTKLADALVKHVGVLAVSQVGAMRKVATYFAEALARKIYKICPVVGHHQDLLSLPVDSDDVLQMHFYETGPYLKFAHFTANQAILEAFAGANRVHVVDFSLKQGMQWPALMQALALRPGGPPAFRLTGVGPPQPDNTDALQEVGWKLAQLAETVGIEFEFRGFVANSLADLDASMFDIIRPTSNVEAVAVNSVLELHRTLSRPGAIEKVLNLVKAMNPKIVTVVEQEANHNGGVFLERFNEALHYYSTMFDSLESCSNGVDSHDLAMTEVYLGRQICNVVASQGAERVERHETLAQWRSRMRLAGFDAVHLGSNAFKQASMLLALFAGGGGYRVDESDGCLMLGWHTRPLITTSAWRINGGD